MGLAQVQLGAGVQGIGTSQTYELHSQLPPAGIKGRVASVKRFGVGYYRVFDNGTRWEVMSGESVVSSTNFCSLTRAANTSDVKFPIFTNSTNFIGVGEIWKIQYWTSGTNIGYSRLFIDGQSPAMQTVLSSNTTTYSTKTISYKPNNTVDTLDFNGALGAMGVFMLVGLMEISLRATVIGDSFIVTNLIVTRVS